MASRSADGAFHDTLTIPQGAAWNRSWPITDATGNPLTLTGWSVRAQIRQTPATPNPPFFEWNTTPGTGIGVATASGTTVTLTLTGTTDSALWTFESGQFDVFLTNPSGQPTRIIEGTVQLVPSVTH